MAPYMYPPSTSSSSSSSQAQFDNFNANVAMQSRQMHDNHASSRSFQMGSTKETKEITSVFPKPAYAFRTGRRDLQPGNVSIARRRGAQALAAWTVFSPNERMFVKWELPMSMYKSCKTLSIALQWYGGLNNHQNIVAKKVSANESHKDVARGEIQFFAPKGAGTFVFRLYDACSDEIALTTLGTSTEVMVQLRDEDLVSSLKLVVDSFRKRSADMTAFTQLRATAEGCRFLFTYLCSTSPILALSFPTSLSSYPFFTR